VKLTVREDPRSALPLMEDVLRGGAALAPDYPLVFGEAGSGRAVVIEEAGRVISSCAILERDLRIADRLLRVGLIGSVATAPEHRGRGLASTVLVEAEAELRAHGCVLAMLWADSPAYYEGRGYQTVGAERDFLLSPELRAHLPAANSVRVAQKADLAAMHALYIRHVQRVERSEEESAELYQTPGMDVLVSDGVSGVEAYACCGRGGDLVGVVHEWAGETEPVLACLAAHVERAAPGQELALMSPHAPDPVTERLTALGCPSAVGSLGMAKLLDPMTAAEFLSRASAVPLRTSAGSGGVLLLEAGERSVEVTEAELLGLLLPPHGERSALESLECRVGTSFEALPLGAFIWGLDSI
jgi:GNAT superfamily N-acetyltransferase